MSMSKDKIQEFQIGRWSDNKKEAQNRKWYAIQRFDLLIISISGAIIYSSLEVIKYCSINEIILDKYIVKFCLVFSVLTIIINFISQIFGYMSNSKDEIYNNMKYREALGENINSFDFEHTDSWVQHYNYWVDIYNVVSCITLSVSLVFTCFLFKDIL